jgi:hypothetical protein
VVGGCLPIQLLKELRTRPSTRVFGAWESERVADGLQDFPEIGVYLEFAQVATLPLSARAVVSLLKSEVQTSRKTFDRRLCLFMF